MLVTTPGVVVASESLKIKGLYLPNLNGKGREAAISKNNGEKDSNGECTTGQLTLCATLQVPQPLVNISPPIDSFQALLSCKCKCQYTVKCIDICREYV